MINDRRIWIKAVIENLFRDLTIIKDDAAVDRTRSITQAIGTALDDPEIMEFMNSFSEEHFFEGVNENNIAIDPIRIKIQALLQKQDITAAQINEIYFHSIECVLQAGNKSLLHRVFSMDRVGPLLKTEEELQAPSQLPVEENGEGEEPTVASNESKDSEQEAEGGEPSTQKFLETKWGKCAALLLSGSVFLLVFHFLFVDLLESKLGWDPFQSYLFTFSIFLLIASLYIVFHPSRRYFRAFGLVLGLFTTFLSFPFLTSLYLEFSADSDDSQVRLAVKTIKSEFENSCGSMLWGLVILGVLMIVLIAFDFVERRPKNAS